MPVRDDILSFSFQEKGVGMSFIDIVLIEDLTPDPSPVRRGEKGSTNFTNYIEFNELVKE